MCQVPRHIEPGEQLSVVLRKDAVLQRAMNGSVEVKPGLHVALQPGDIFELPATVKVQSEKLGQLAELLGVRSAERMPAKIETTLKEKMREEPRYEICMATMMKPYAYLLDDWIGYHRRLGVDMVYIIDNDSPEDLNERFASQRDVEVVFWPWARSQVQALSYLLVTGRGRCEWMLLTDADEFLMFGMGEDGSLSRPLKRYANRRREEGYEEAMFHFLRMGASGHFKRPDGALPEAYTHIYAYRGPADDNGKSMCLTDSEWLMSMIHWGWSITPVVMHSFMEKERIMYPVKELDSPRLMHYQFRSWEEFSVKQSYESPSIADTRFRTGALNVKGSSDYLRVEEADRYVHFRDIYRKVMRSEIVKEQTLVRTTDRHRCTVVHKVDENESFKSQECEVIL